MECINPRYLSKSDVTVPCGKCAFCLATRRSDWVSRLIVEWKHSEASCFVTLTYATPHLTWRGGISQLVKADLQKWFKRVRKQGYRFRYYAVGEYGSQTYRPHYHVLLFGNVPERVIRQTWDKGTVHIGQITLASCGYCCKYVINSKHWTMKNKREKPFAIMSRRPGIGTQYLTVAMKEWHKSGRKNYMLVDGAKRHLPRFYKEKIFSKIDRVRIANRDQRAALESLRAELLRIGKKNPRMKNPMEYRELQLRKLAASIKDKSRQSLTI